MADHCRPLHMFQENLRVPLIFRHPAGIPPGRAARTMVANYDFFPSLLDYLELRNRIPQAPALPGRSYAAELRGEGPPSAERAVFHEYETARAVQTAEWKLVRRHPEGPHELYNLKDDPGERWNLLANGEAPAAEADLSGRLERFFERHADPEYDICRGGRSKAGRTEA